jgi:hypothetical protein
MTRKLNEADRAAVDMLFDRINAANNGGRSNGNGNGNGGDGYVTMTVAVAEDRLSAVQRILSTLEQMPAPEPSADLAVRTLQRVAREAGAAMPGATMQTPAPGPFVDPTQPMA